MSTKGKAPKRADSFKIVYIPADDSQPMQEWALPQPKGKEVEALIDPLKAHFTKLDATRGTKISEEAKNQFRDSLKEQVARQLQKTGAEAEAALPDGFLEHMMNAGLIESVPLMGNSPRNEWVAVSCYVDDKGRIKGYPRNNRASAFCQSLNKPVDVIGDAFIGRFFDNEDHFVRLDFTQAELSSDADWFKRAAAQNAEALRSEGKGMQQVLDQVNKANVQKTCAKGGLACRNIGTLRCARCKTILYCSAACQKAHWRLHKLTCKPRPDAAAAPAAAEAKSS